MESFNYKCYENGYAELSEKVTVFKKYLLLKKSRFWKSSCSERSTCFEKLLILKKKPLQNSSYAEKVIFKK